MKKFALAIAIGFSTLAFAQTTEAKKYAPPAGKAVVGDVYGASVSDKAVKTALDVATLEKKVIAAKKLENVAVKGKVTDVCDKKGCWLTLETPNKEKFFVNMKDYGFFVPTALKGKNVVIEGSAQNKVVSVDEQKHYAEDAKKSAAEIAAITQPANEVRFTATGIKVVD